MFDYILSCGADPKALDPSGETPLFYAVAADCLSTVEACLANGMDVNHRNMHGSTAITAVCGEKVCVLIGRV